MIILVSVIHVIICLMLLFIILLQPGRGMGLSSAAFGGSDAQSVFGTKTADVLTKATTVAAVLFMVTCIGLSALTAHRSKSLYSNFKDQAPITMDQIQKAVKEAEEKAAATGAPAVAPDASAVENAAAAVTETADAAVTTATDQAAAAVETATPAEAPQAA